MNNKLKKYINSLHNRSFCYGEYSLFDYHILRIFKSILYFLVDNYVLSEIPIIEENNKDISYKKNINIKHPTINYGKR
jgi:hypothetical protein